MSFERLKGMEIPTSVYEGISWLLSQDESFRNSFANDLHDTEKCKTTKEYIGAFMGLGCLDDFEDNVRNYVAELAVFKNDMYSMHHIRIEVRSAHWNIESTFGECYVTWQGQAGKFKRNFDLQIERDDSIQTIVKQMVKTTENWFRSNILNNWRSKFRVGESMSKTVVDELREYIGLYEDTLIADDGIVVKLESLMFIAECSDGAWMRVDHTSKTYKRYALALNLIK